MKTNYLKYILLVVINFGGILAQEPERVTLLPDSVTETTAILRGYFIANETSWKSSFVLGKTSRCELGEFISANLFRYYSTYSLKKKGDTVFVNCDIKNLVPQTKFYFRLLIKKNGTWRYGNRQTFTTSSDSNAGGFITPISVGKMPPIRFGVHTHASNCIDYILEEAELPPAPPDGTQDFRFIPPRTGMENCYGQGTYLDLRPFYNSTQIDTYKIRIQPTGNIFPFVVKWGNLINQYTGDIRLLSPLNGSIINTDMKTQQSDTIYDDIGYLYIVAKYPTNKLSTWFSDLSNNGVMVKGTYNPSGLETDGWFEWDTTKKYGNATPHQNIGSSTTPVTFVSYINGLLPNTYYYYRVVTQNSFGTFYGVDQTLETNSVTDIQDEPSIPTKFSLTQNYPNPFNPVTVISYQLPVRSYVTLKVYDMLGHEVATVVNEEQIVGNHEVNFNGSNLSSGVYYYRLISGSFVDTKKFLLVK